MTPFRRRRDRRPLRERQIALFRFGERVYALDNREPGSAANVLSRGLLGDVGGEPVVISRCTNSGYACATAGRATATNRRYAPVKVENGKVWVGNQQLLARAEAS
ncbi:nitrite reductase (NAD(P)H) small subunit [Klebsiella pneumoniae]|uniref:Nitrite reductase (NAD(P)H) small subunit n=1 Tax=Klebsiella pneumoniae TaxID=573 RepID=A0A939NI06_KLEPN|nr:nitrite reductase (NAD(P)H) small subunit [Klebsiella pneumoniae]